MRGELVVVDQTRLRVRLLELIDGLKQRLDWILEVVALVDHVRRIEAREPFALGEHQLVEDQEERIRSDRSRREIVVAVHRVVEVKATELPCTEQARDDELDVRARQMMSEIDETLRTVAERLREQQRRTPVLYHRGVERRLVRLVLSEQSPVVRCRSVDLLQTFPHAIEAPTQRRLSWKIRAVREPDRDGLRPDQLADLDHAQMMLDRLAPHRRVGIAERAELIAQALARLILKGVRVHRVEPDAQPSCVVEHFIDVVELVPRDVEGQSRRAGGQTVHEGGVLHLLAERVRLASAGEPAEASPSSRERPRRERDLEAVHRGDQLFRVAPRTLQASSELGEVALVVPLGGGIELEGYGGNVG